MSFKTKEFYTDIAARFRGWMREVYFLQISHVNSLTEYLELLEYLATYVDYLKSEEFSAKYIKVTRSALIYLAEHDLLDV